MKEGLVAGAKRRFEARGDFSEPEPEITKTKRRVEAGPETERGIKERQPEGRKREIVGRKGYVKEKGEFIKDLDSLMEKEMDKAEKAAKDEVLNAEGTMVVPPEYEKPTTEEMSAWREWRDKLNSEDAKQKFTEQYNKLKKKHKGEDLRLEVVKLVDDWIQGRNLTGRVAAPAGWANRRIAELGIPDYMYEKLGKTLYKVSARDSRKNFPKLQYTGIKEHLKQAEKLDAQKEAELGELEEAIGSLGKNTKEERAKTEKQRILKSVVARRRRTA